MWNLLVQTFTWWNGQTMGTRFATWRFGKRVGEDEFGNVYYEGGMSSYGLPKRWVIYKGYAEASAIPPGWHGWMHHRTDVPRPRRATSPRIGRSHTGPTIPVRRRPIVRRAPSPFRANVRASPAITTPGRPATETARPGKPKTRLLATIDLYPQVGRA